MIVTEIQRWQYEKYEFSVRKVIELHQVPVNLVKFTHN